MNTAFNKIMQKINLVHQLKKLKILSTLQQQMLFLMSLKNKKHHLMT
jgi:hypothetical protein